MTELGFPYGHVVAWRNCPRDASRRHSPSFAIGMRVLRDAAQELVLFRGNGYPMRRRNSERASIAGFRHQPVIKHLEGWQPSPEWTGPDVIVVMDPGARHATSLFRDRESGVLQFWYIDIIGPVTRDGDRLDFLEHGLDVVVEPDLSSWRFKDEDELEWQVRQGIYSRAEADALYAEGKNAVQQLHDRSEVLADWLRWRADPSWDVPLMPYGWDEIS